MVTPGQDHDITQTSRLLADYRPRSLIADKGYDSDAVGPIAFSAITTAVPEETPLRLLAVGTIGLLAAPRCHAGAATAGTKPFHAPAGRLAEEVDFTMQPPRDAQILHVYPLRSQS